MRTKTSILDISEQKRLKRYYICASIASAAFGAMLASGALVLLLSMIDDIFLRNETLYAAGFVVGLALMVICAVVFLCMVLVAKLGTSGKKYRAIVEKVEARQKKVDSTRVMAGIGGQMAGKLIASNSSNESAQKAEKALSAAATVATTVGVFQTLCAISENVEVVMKRAKMTVPKVGRYARITFFVPVLIVLLTYVPEYVGSIQTIRSERNAIRVNWHYLNDYFQERGYRVSGDDPVEWPKYPHHYLTIMPYAEGVDNRSEVNISVEDKGLIDSIRYEIYLKGNREEAENMRKLRDTITNMQQEIGQAVRSGDIPVSDPHLLEVPTDLLDEFIRQFEAAPYQKKISVSNSSEKLPYMMCVGVNVYNKEPLKQDSWAYAFYWVGGID